MGKNSAEYMRAYRAKRKADHASYDADKPLIGQLKTQLGEAQRRMEELGEEVRHLKAELANRHTALIAEVFGPREIVVRPRKTQQAQRDAILGKVNRRG